jgi:probable phosphoglycerate mutase
VQHRQTGGVLGAAVALDRALQAEWAAGPADGLAEFHEGRIEGARRFGGAHKFLGALPQAFLAGGGIDAIWCSPLQRARGTARCVTEVLGIEPVIVAELAERNWGELEGQPRALRVRNATPPGGESPEAFRLRTLIGLQQIGASRMPLIVAHSGTFRVLGAWLDLPPQDSPVPNSLPLLFDRSADGRWHCNAL